MNGAGDRLAAGAYANNGNGADSGTVKVYQLSGSSWVRLGSDLDGEAAGDNFGWFVVGLRWKKLSLMVVQLIVVSLYVVGVLTS